MGTEPTRISVMTTEEFVSDIIKDNRAHPERRRLRPRRSRTPSYAVAQHEYDTNPESRELLARAEPSPTVRREAGDHRSE
ncbi:MAG: hypothetical protein WBW75_25120 [Mycobacterium sp.]|uniref:hypothetical protein n=1 Tax=Mycobacterium sp. TaxID=1785 RepID=UPI003C54B008